MLRVPDLKAGEEPFNPDLYTDMNAARPIDHGLKGNGDIGTSKGGKSGAILMGRKPEGGLSDNAAPTGEAEWRERLRRMLDHAVVKDAVTSLHAEENTQLESLAAYEGIDICQIPTDQKTFLDGQKAKYGAMFVDGAQKRLFAKMTAEYFTGAMMRAVRLQEKKTLEYRNAVIERQNREFLDRALRTENIMNDRMQKTYRDMILFNLENLYEDASEEERRERMDRASESYYRAVLEKRLELDPASVEVMLESAAVCRVLGESAASDFADRAARAVVGEGLRRQAKGWVDEGMGPAEARKRAETEFADREEAKEVVRHYAWWRYNDNRKVVLTRILNIGKAWRMVKEGGMHIHAIPDWVRRNDGELFAFLRDLLLERDARGGLPAEPEYDALLDWFEKFQPHTTLESLREDARLFRLMTCCGGPDAEAFQVILRLLTGKMERGDRAWFEDLLWARRELRDSVGGDVPKVLAQSYLAAFDTARRLRLEKDAAAELGCLDSRALIKDCLELAVARAE